MSQRKRQVGVITQATIDLLGLSNIEANKEICVGPTNISHMQRSHPEDFARYGDRLEDVIQSPHYVMLHPSDGSIRFIREYIEDGERVLVAVRASSGGSFFARSLYTIEEAKLESYRNTGNLVDYVDGNKDEKSK
jgi:hypothetical protein